MMKNWQKFKDHPDYGGVIKAAGLPNRMPSARYLDTYRPYWVKYVHGIIEGCNAQLYAVKHNYCTMRKLFRKLNVDAVTESTFPELFVDWLKLKLREQCGSKSADARYDCETLQCQQCHPRRLFLQDVNGVCLLEKDFPMTPAQRSGLKLPFFEMETEDLELKSLDAKGKPKIWKIKSLGSREFDFQSWLDRFEEQLEQPWLYHEKVLLNS